MIVVIGIPGVAGIFKFIGVGAGAGDDMVHPADNSIPIKRSKKIWIPRILVIVSPAFEMNQNNKRPVSVNNF
jgi:hypothetical protein